MNDHDEYRIDEALANPDPATAAGRDYGRLTDLRDAIIEAVQTQDGIGAIKAFAAYDDFIEAEARAPLDVCRHCPQQGHTTAWHEAHYTWFSEGGRP